MITKKDKPCPFCASDNIQLLMHESEYKCTFTFSCLDCGFTPFLAIKDTNGNIKNFVWFEKIIDASEFWDTRHRRKKTEQEAQE